MQAAGNALAGELRAHATKWVETNMAAPHPAIIGIASAIFAVRTAAQIAKMNGVPFAVARDTFKKSMAAEADAEFAHQYEVPVIAGLPPGLGSN